MNATSEFLVRSMLMGAGATLTMDLCNAGVKRFGVPSLNFAYLGRWLAHLSRGRFIHENIASRPPFRGEQWIGWGAHYSIGGLGAGIASSKTKTPVFNALKSLVSHVVFGFGLFLSARATVLIVSVIN